MNLAGGFGFEGGHPETKGLSVDGRIISVPLHEHEVSLDYWRTELELEYTFAQSWDLVFRLPFDVKSQTATVDLVTPVSPAQREDILRNRDIHHRNESYKGIGDLGLLFAHRRYAVLRDGDFLKLAFGATFPTGDTEENPYALGRLGLRHLHIQFGSGTVDPHFEIYYRTPVSRRLSLSPYLFGHVPIYENGRGYQAANEWTTGMNVSYQLSPRWTVHGNATWFYQGFAWWGAERDVNSGLKAWSTMFGATLKLRERTSIGLDLRLPISQRTLVSGGDSFRHGPVLLLRLSTGM